MPQVALLVDDEQPVRAYLAAVLREGGFQVLEAEDGSDALSIIQQMHGILDVLVTDIRMPRMTGIELVGAVKIDFLISRPFIFPGKRRARECTTRVAV
jgi:CheY-like chemotaxis protein